VRVRPLLVRIGLGLVLAGVLAMALHSIGWSLALRATLRVGPAALAPALALTVLSMLISGVVWTRVLGCLGHRATITVGITLYAGTGLAAYLGSGAGAAGESIVLLRRRGVCAGRAVLLLALASLVGFLGSIVWAPCGMVLLAAPTALHALPALGTHGPLLVLIATVVCGVGGLVVLLLLTLSPRLSTRWRLARLVLDPSGPPLRLSLPPLLALIPVAAIAWVVGAVPLWLLVRAAAPSAALSLPEAIGVQSVAAVIGSVTFFLPNGLGARDGAILGLLVAIAGVPLPAAAAAAVLVRLSDPVAKALILLALAGLRRVPPLSPALPTLWRAAAASARGSIRRSVSAVPADT
jgi:glycosyltransferase 2 family protein